MTANLLPAAHIDARTRGRSAQTDVLQQQQLRSVLEQLIYLDWHIQAHERARDSQKKKAGHDEQQQLGD